MVEKIEDILPPKDEYDVDEADQEMKTIVALHDLREIGVLANGEPEEGEQTWYLTDTGVAWVEGRIDLDLKELAKSEDVDEEQLYGTYEDFKAAEMILRGLHNG